MTTPQDLAAQIEAAAAKAKPGDWKNYRCFGTAQGAPNEICVSGNYASGAVGSAIRAEDAELICLLKNNVPAILAAIRQGEGAGDCISREQAASAIERTTVADGASASDILVFLAAAIRDDRVTPSISPAPDERDDEVRRLKAQLERIGKFVDDYKSPWGSWKTAWWEGEVSDNAAFSNDNALMHVANLSRAALSPAKGRD